MANWIQDQQKFVEREIDTLGGGFALGGKLFAETTVKDAREALQSISVTSNESVDKWFGRQTGSAASYFQNHSGDILMGAGMALMMPAGKAGLLINGVLLASSLKDLSLATASAALEAAKPSGNLTNARMLLSDAVSHEARNFTYSLPMMTLGSTIGHRLKARGLANSVADFKQIYAEAHKGISTMAQTGIEASRMTPAYALAHANGVSLNWNSRPTIADSNVLMMKSDKQIVLRDFDDYPRAFEVKKETKSGKEFKNFDLEQVNDQIPKDSIAIPVLKEEGRGFVVRVVPKSDPSAKLFESINKSILRLDGESPHSKEYAIGTGFLVGSNGKFVTAGHCAVGESNFSVKTATGDSYPAQLLDYDFNCDLAVFKVIGLPDKFAPLIIKNRPRFGGEYYPDDVLLLGYPCGSKVLFAAQGTGTNPHFRHVEKGLVEELEFFGETRGGNSGGPIVGPDGSVLAVHTKTTSRFGGSEMCVGTAVSDLTNFLKSSAEKPGGKSFSWQLYPEKNPRCIKLVWS